MRVSVDLGGLQAHYRALERITTDNIDRGVSGLSGEAKDMAVDLINAQIYDTPPRGGYDRTGALKASVYAAKDRHRRTRWRIMVGARGGAGGREYALYNERGTYGGRVSLESILKRAEGAALTAGLIRLQYGDPSKGLEPRPWTIPTAVAVSRMFVAVVQQAVREAEREARGAKSA